MNRICRKPATNILWENRFYLENKITKTLSKSTSVILFADFYFFSGGSHNRKKWRLIYAPTLLHLHGNWFKNIVCTMRCFKK